MKIFTSEHSKRAFGWILLYSILGVIINYGIFSLYEKNTGKDIYNFPIFLI